jgi:3-methyladenine DNA glycosylase AlkD
VMGAPVEVPAWVEVALRKEAIPERGEYASRYFPTEMQILGVPAPELRKVVGRLHLELKGESPGRVVEMAFSLKAMGIHECRQVAYELLDRRRDARSLLGIRKVRALGKGNDNWASVDGFSVFVSGPVWREGRIPDGEVLAWAASRDRWWRRTALVSTVPLNMRSRGGTGDATRTLRVCQALVSDRDPMVAKALSWALRALVGVNRKAVERYLEVNNADLPSLVKREVRTKLQTGRKVRRL